MFQSISYFQVKWYGQLPRGRRYETDNVPCAILYSFYHSFPRSLLTSLLFFPILLGARLRQQRKCDRPYLVLTRQHNNTTFSGWHDSYCPPFPLTHYSKLISQLASHSLFLLCHVSCVMRHAS